MIVKMTADKLEEVTNIWLETNLSAYSFIDENFWLSNLPYVKEALATAEVYICEEDKQVLGFIGLEKNYIAGIFVKDGHQAKGIGRSLLEQAKNLRGELFLNVYARNERAVAFYKKENFKIKKEGIDEETDQKEYEMFWSK